MKTVVYPGSFDPVTLGHLDIIKRVYATFGELTVLVSNSSEKNYTFSSEERKQFLEGAIKDALGERVNIKVDIFDGLTVNYLRDNNHGIIIRGIRAIADFEYELVMANMNKKMAKEIETLVFFTSPKYHYVSSRAIKEVARLQGPLSDFVPNNVEKALVEKFN